MKQIVFKSINDEKISMKKPSNSSMIFCQGKIGNQIIVKSITKEEIQGKSISFWSKRNS
jgi:hypothetical protein